MIKKILVNPDFLPRPEAMFNRALELQLGSYKIILISGTASVGPNLETMFPGDFEKQAWRTYHNIKEIVMNRGCTIRDVVRWGGLFKEYR